jgi:porin
MGHAVEATTWRTRAVRGTLPRLLALTLPTSLAQASPHPHPPVPPADDDTPLAQLAGIYTGEVWRVARGAESTGYVWIDQLDLIATINGEQTLAVPGLMLYAHALYHGGGSVSTRTGDAQGPSNIEAPQGLKLLELWADWRPGRSSRHSLRAGVYDVNSEFDALPSAALFLNSSQGIGVDLAQTGANGPSIFPTTGLALRYRHEAANGWSLIAAAVDGVPGDPERPRATSFRFSSDEGALGIVEASYSNGRLAKLAAGAWAYSAKFEHLTATDARGDPLLLRRNRGAYAHAEYAFGPTFADGAAAASAFLRYGRANADINRFGSYLGAGVVLRGLLGDAEGRRDELGLALAQARNGGPWRAQAAASGAAANRAETVLELTWRIPVNDWLVLQPDVQWIRNPDTDPTRRAALAAALRIEIGIEHAITRAGARR